MGQSIQTQIVSSIKGDSDSDESSQEDSSANENQQEENAISDSGLPNAIQELLGGNQSGEIASALGADNIYQYIGKYFSIIVVNIVGYLIAYLVIWVVLHSIAHAICKAVDIPILRGFNRLAGGILGFGKGIIALLLFFLLVTAMSHTDFGHSLVRMIEENQLLSWLYENNPLLAALEDITKQLFG